MGKGLSKYLTLEGLWLDMAVHIYNPNPWENEED